MQKLRQNPTPVILLIAPFAFAEPEVVPLEMFTTEDSNLEVTLWAQTPMFNNPTNMDIDKDGRIWIAEGVNYRRHGSRRPEGDRIVVLQNQNTPRHERRRPGRQKPRLRPRKISHRTTWSRSTR